MLRRPRAFLGPVFTILMPEDEKLALGLDNEYI
jgi:hypothetical protein